MATKTSEQPLSQDYLDYLNRYPWAKAAGEAAVAKAERSNKPVIPSGYTSRPQTCLGTHLNYGGYGAGTGKSATGVAVTGTGVPKGAQKG